MNKKGYALLIILILVVIGQAAYLPILYSNSLWIINYFTIIIILAINISCGKYYFSYFTTFYN